MLQMLLFLHSLNYTDITAVVNFFVEVWSFLFLTNLELG